MINNYEIITILDPDGNELEQIHRTDADGTVWFIPADLANSDYQRYLAWLENPEPEEELLPFHIFVEPTIELEIEETTESLTEQSQEEAE
jgi:hypothetical protein